MSIEALQEMTLNVVVNLIERADNFRDIHQPQLYTQAFIIAEYGSIVGLVEELGYHYFNSVTFLKEVHLAT
jgi:hypothetical protein